MRIPSTSLLLLAQNYRHVDDAIFEASLVQSLVNTTLSSSDYREPQFIFEYISFETSGSFLRGGARVPPPTKLQKV